MLGILDTEKGKNIKITIIKNHNKSKDEFDIVTD